MFTVLKDRDDLARDDYGDPGWYKNPPGTVARCISTDPDFGNPIRYRGTAPTKSVPGPEMPDMPGMSHTQHNG
jgi:hypothetical protein